MADKAGYGRSESGKETLIYHGFEFCRWAFVLCLAFILFWHEQRHLSCYG